MTGEDEDRPMWIIDVHQRVRLGEFIENLEMHRSGNRSISLLKLHIDPTDLNQYVYEVTVETWHQNEIRMWVPQIYADMVKEWWKHLEIDDEEFDDTLTSANFSWSPMSESQTANDTLNDTSMTSMTDSDS